MVICKYFIR